MNVVSKNSVLNVVGACLLLSLLSSCFKKDDKVVLPPPGNLEYAQVHLGENYTRQVYFKFRTTDTIGNDYTKWDLAFDASQGGYHIWINGGNFALVARVGSSDLFNTVKDTVGVAWQWDTPDWNPQTTAIGEWTTNIPTVPPSNNSTNQFPNLNGWARTDADETNLYIIDRGPAFSGTERFWKIAFQTVDQSTYTMQYAHLDGSSLMTQTLYKNSSYNYIYFSFDNGGKTVDMEPVKNTWDILFTRYRYIFHNPTIPYLVEGVLINPTNTSVACDSVTPFANIDYNHAKNLPFTTQRDIIGWDWKVYNFSTGYSIRPGLNYIIKDAEGYYWKMQFTGYEDANGEKGNPKFEFQRL